IHPTTTTHSVLPSVRLTTSAPRSVTFRRLNHTACSPAVYASRLGLLRSHHATLASRWRPTFAGQDLNLLGCFSKVHITSILLRQASPGAPAGVKGVQTSDAKATRPTAGPAYGTRSAV